MVVNILPSLLMHLAAGASWRALARAVRAPVAHERAARVRRGGRAARARAHDCVAQADGQVLPARSLYLLWRRPSWLPNLGQLLRRLCGSRLM